MRAAIKAVKAIDMSMVLLEYVVAKHYMSHRNQWNLTQE